MNIHHIAIWTNDLEKEKNFFIQYFECTSNAKYENHQKQFSSYFLSFPAGCHIELMKRNDIHLQGNPDSFGLSHIAISVGSKGKVDTLSKRLEKDGFTIESYPRTTGDGYYESVILDPENNRIELIFHI
jgi:lactoylglutathione lyase